MDRTVDPGMQTSLAEWLRKWQGGSADWGLGIEGEREEETQRAALVVKKQTKKNKA